VTDYSMDVTLSLLLMEIGRYFKGDISKQGCYKFGDLLMVDRDWEEV
jgi:hypothetical protein